MNGTVEGVLAHFGVKGMRWGVRRKRSAAPASSDAATARSAQNKSKTDGLHSLSNKELQDLVTRMNLERQFKALQPPSKKQQAAQFAAKILLDVGKQQVQRLASDALAKQVAKMMAKSLVG